MKAAFRVSDARERVGDSRRSEPMTTTSFLNQMSRKYHWAFPPWPSLSSTRRKTAGPLYVPEVKRHHHHPKLLF